MGRLRAPRRVCLVVIVAIVVSLSTISTNAWSALAQKTLVVAQGTNPEVLSTIAPSNSAFSLMSQMFDALTKRDELGKIQPGLAESWEAVNPTTWLFRIRRGVTFHNGEPLDASAVKFSIDWIRDPARPNVRASRIGLVDNLEVVDPFTVRLTTKQPFPTLLWGLSQALILPPKYLVQVGEQEFARRPIGTGPFKLVEFVQGNRIVLEANANYWGGRPKLNRLIFRQVPEPSARVAALKSGEAQVVEYIPVDLVRELRVDPNLRVISTLVEKGIVIQLDTLTPGPVANVKVRQALDSAIDKVGLTRALLGDLGVPLDGQVMTKGAFGYNPLVKRTPQDLARARKLLAEAGYPNGFDFEINTPVGFEVVDRDLTIAIAGQLERVGVRTKVNAQEVAVWLRGLTTGKAGPAFLVSWYNFGDADLALTWFSTGTRYSHYWKNEEFDRLIQIGKTTLDRATREDAYRRAILIMRDQLPAIPILQPPAIYGLSAKVTGWKPRADETWYFVTTDLQ